FLTVLESEDHVKPVLFTDHVIPPAHWLVVPVPAYVASVDEVVVQIALDSRSRLRIVADQLLPDGTESIGRDHVIRERVTDKRALRRIDSTEGRRLIRLRAADVGRLGIVNLDSKIGEV